MGGFVYAESARSLSFTQLAVGVFRAKRLLNTGLCWRHAGKDQLDFRSLAGFAIEIDPATQTIRDDVVDDRRPRPALP